MPPTAPSADRERFATRVTDAISRAGTGRRVAVLLVHLDRADVEAALGDPHGARLLAQAADRLGAELGSRDAVTRLRGDDFGVVVDGLASVGDALAVGERVRAVLLRPFPVAGIAVEVDVSVGLACAPDHGATAGELLGHADLGLGAARAARGGVRTYDAEPERRTPERLDLAGEMLEAMRRGEITAYFQPVVDVATGAVLGGEALARWRHATRGVLPAGEWMGLAERIGLLAPLTDAVLDHALTELARWRADGYDLVVAVNLARVSFLGDGLLDQVAVGLERRELPPDRMRLEITEHMIAGDEDRARVVLARLGAMGVRVSLDDFGTGDSSLTQLTRLPVDEVKLDRTSVQGLLEDRAKRALARAVISLAHDLGLRVVAEGVSDDRVLAALRELGCDAAQGFLFAPALPGREFATWLESSNRPLPRLAGSERVAS